MPWIIGLVVFKWRCLGLIGFNWICINPMESNWGKLNPTKSNYSKTNQTKPWKPKEFNAKQSQASTTPIFREPTTGPCTACVSHELETRTMLVTTLGDKLTQTMCLVAYLLDSAQTRNNACSHISCELLGLCLFNANRTSEIFTTSILGSKHEMFDKCRKSKWTTNYKKYNSAMQSTMVGVAKPLLRAPFHATRQSTSKHHTPPEEQQYYQCWMPMTKL